MMIPFDFLVSKYNIKAKGCCHIGGNRGQEALIYKQHGINNVIWVEALNDVYKDLSQYLESVDCFGPGTVCINACLGDVDGKEVVFHRSNNEDQSSSYLELGVHSEIHPTVVYVEDIPMIMTRAKTVLRDFDMSGYDLLNIDTQGSELEVLKGLSVLLAGFKWAIIEINMRETYKGGALVSEIDEYMAIFDFVRVETGTWVAETWTDGFFIKKDLL